MGKSRFSRLLMDFLRSRVPRYVSPFVRSRHARMQIPRLTRNAEGVRALIRGTGRLDPQGNINLYRTAAQAEKALLRAGRIANRSTVNNNMRHLIGSSAHGLRVGFNKVAPWLAGGLGLTAVGASVASNPHDSLVDALTTSGWANPERRDLPQNPTMFQRFLNTVGPGKPISPKLMEDIRHGRRALMSNGPTYRELLRLGGTLIAQGKEHVSLPANYPHGKPIQTHKVVRKQRFSGGPGNE